MKILSIGDVHGRDGWKFYTHGSSYEYDLWKVSIDAGAPVDADLWSEFPYTQVDKIIFVGDYVDSYDKSNDVILKNLLEIIEFKKLMGDKVVLLLGNHDIQYIVPKQICSGFRPESKIDLNELFERELDLFKLAHEETGEDGSKWLWTHAGVTSGWFEESLMKVFNSPKHRFKMLFDEWFKWAEVDREERSVAEILNFAWDMKLEVLWNVDNYSGGMSTWAGPVWVRPGMLTYWPLEGYNQVVGHTPQAALWVVDDDPDNVPFDGFKIHFIDFMGRVEADPFIVEI